ncbi:MAG: DNA translocase FtsK [Chloroflexi bacterium]|nr:DNA translocase FtsK [Chloroflexota bacterium]
MARRKPETNEQPMITPSAPAPQREIAGLALIALGTVTLLALSAVSRGALSDWWAGFLRRIFGWGAPVIALTLLALGGLLLWPPYRRPKVPWPAVIGLEVVFVALLGVLHLLGSRANPVALPLDGGRGGYVGWAVAYFPTKALGWGLALLMLLAVVLTMLFAMAPASAAEIVRRIRTGWERALTAYRLWRESRSAITGEAPPIVGPPPRERKGVRVKRIVRTEPEKAAPQTKERPRRAPAPRDKRLPPLDLLEQYAPKSLSESEIRRRARIIEETLESFGAPGKVVEINRGPTVTQFGVEPGFVERRLQNGEVAERKIRVSKILSLADDLALALAAAPIRIEAPVPGRSVIGIEVPNSDLSLVSLRSVMESEVFQKIDSNLRIALGQDVSGNPVAADLASMPHLLIAGATGSGKSVCINSIIACLLFNNTPDDVRMIMVDPKMVELTNFNGIPHLIAPVITEVEEVVRALKWVTQEMDSRYRTFALRGVRNLDIYNQMASRKGWDKLPNIVIFIDELADLMLVSPDDVEWAICRIAQLARATGIHLVLATQRPSVEVVTGLIKANFPARISFAVTSQVDSRVVLDTGGAEKLLGRGDMLYMASDSSKLMRLQGCYVSDAELARLVNFWREHVEWIGPPARRETAPWQSADLEGEESDELLEDAIQLLRGRDRVSVSFLQRRLHIGYPRAARLMDILEHKGIVGPDEGAGRSREVLLPLGENPEPDE